MLQVQRAEPELRVRGAERRADPDGHAVGARGGGADAAEALPADAAAGDREAHRAVHEEARLQDFSAGLRAHRRHGLQRARLRLPGKPPRAQPEPAQHPRGRAGADPARAHRRAAAGRALPHHRHQAAAEEAGGDPERVHPGHQGAPAIGHVQRARDAGQGAAHDPGGHPKGLEQPAGAQGHPGRAREDERQSGRHA